MRLSPVIIVAKEAFLTRLVEENPGFVVKELQSALKTQFGTIMSHSRLCELRNAVLGRIMGIEGFEAVLANARVAVAKEEPKSLIILATS